MVNPIRPTTLLIAPALAALMLFSLAPTVAARDCGGTLDTQCSHATADGTCHLYVGGAAGNGRCYVYGDAGGSQTTECDQKIETNCTHATADGTCYVYVGGTSGRCYVYSGS